MSFGALDWLVLGLFMLALLGIVVWMALQKEEDTEDYVLAGGGAGWLVIGASIFRPDIHRAGVPGAALLTGHARTFFSFISLVSYVLTKVSVTV